MIPSSVLTTAEITVSGAPQSSGTYYMTYGDLLDTLQGIAEFYFETVDPHRPSSVPLTADSMEFQIRRFGRSEAIGTGKVVYCPR